MSSEQFLGLASEILSQGHSLRFRARGISMRPFIRDGDLLEIRPILAHQIRLGDILLYQLSKNHTLVHRVVRFKAQAGRRWLLLQGDALLQPDGLIDPGQVLGRVVYIERPSKRLSIQSPGQRLLATGLAVTLPWLKRLL